MCYIAELYISESGNNPVEDFIMVQDIETQDWILSGIRQFEQHKGRINNQNLETKHIRNKVFELKFKKLSIRILFAYHPVKRKVILLLSGVIKKRADLKNADIKTAEDRYDEVKNRA
jgi:hypothetical protein